MNYIKLQRKKALIHAAKDKWDNCLDHHLVTKLITR